MIYVEVEIADGDISLTPRAVPFDLTAEWYNTRTRR